ncbi:MAG: hypothetical protein JSW11_05845 [Candidatus Heimdallarchaeota archaeon]|nr:MAG: hypothetical protein JSW11_05845 [Candidatus Heimdallarchaeota archaeon]
MNIRVFLNLKVRTAVILITTLLFFNISILGDSVSIKIDTEPDPLFHIHMIAPINNIYRMQLAHRMERELESIGISCDLDLVNWGMMGPRCYYDEANTFLEDGYDLALLGMTISSPTSHPGNNLLAIYHNDAVPPLGYNMMMWSNRSTEFNDYRASEASDLIDALDVELDFSKAKQLIVDWQKIFYDVMPHILTYHQCNIHAVSTGLYGYDPTGYPIASAENHWLESDYAGTAGKIVLGASGSGTRFYDFLGNSLYDQYVAAPVQDALVGNTPSREVNIPTNVDRKAWMKEHYHDIYGTSGYLEQYPRIAVAMGTYDLTGTKYTITIRDDVYWHDGHKVDAWDVAFGFQAELQPDLGSSSYSTLKTAFGLDDKTNNHGNFSFIVTDEDVDGFYETIEFNLAQIYAPFLFSNLATSIKPEHILGDPGTHGFDATGDFDVSLWEVQPRDWIAHSMNTANPQDQGGYKGPIGCGSLVFYNRDPTSKVVTLKKFDGIRWDDATEDWVEDGTLRHYLAADGLLDDMPDEYTMVEGDMNSIVSNCQEGSVNIIDPIFTMTPILNHLQDHEKITVTYSTESGWQSLYMNPKFTTSTELGSTDRPFNRKGVRHAISHIIPREEIINDLLGGLGKPAYSPFSHVSWAAVSEAELLTYKQSIVATDGSRLETSETAAWDSYDRQLALDWLESEGYDVSPWRAYVPPDLPSWPTNKNMQWDSRIRNGTTISFKIDQLVAEDGSNVWHWDQADITLAKDDIINITWIADPNKDELVEINGPVTYDIEVSIGGTSYNLRKSRRLGWFILPLVTTDGFGELESGIRAAERYFSYTFQFFGTVPENDYCFIMEDDPTLHNTGKAASPGTFLHGYILTCDTSQDEREERVFNLTYNALSGILDSLIFTNSQGGNPSSGKIESKLVKGLSQLEISFISISESPVPSTAPTSTAVPTSTQAPETTTETIGTKAAPSITSSWSVSLILTTLLTIAIRWKRRKQG